MKRIASRSTFVFLALALSSAAWAQQRDLEVTMEVVPPDASASAAVNEIKLPDSVPEHAAAHDNAAFGLETANRARELRNELGTDFGREVSEAARERAQERIPSFVPPKPPAK